MVVRATVRRLLVGLSILALLSVCLIGFLRSNDDGRIASVTALAGATPATEASAEPQSEFPEHDLQAGLAAICANDPQDTVDAVPPHTYDQMTAVVSEHLADSSSGEHLLALAFLQKDPASRIDLIKRAVSAGPATPFLLWSAVRICSDSGDAADCPLREWERRLIAVDGRNSETWMRVATNRYAAGEESAALEAMRYASTAAESTIYWTESIELVERALLAVGGFDVSESAVFGMGVAAAQIPHYSGLTTMCNEQSSEKAEWASVCLKYGELVEAQGRTEISVSIARSVQELVFENLGAPERAAEVEKRVQADLQEKRDWANRFSTKFAQLITQNPRLFDAYLAEVRSEGEVDARRRVAADVGRLIRQHPELACE